MPVQAAVISLVVGGAVALTLIAIRYLFTSRIARRLAVAVATLLTILFGVSTAAFAQTESTYGHTYVSSQDCPYINTHIDNSAANPYLYTYGSIDWFDYFDGVDCGDTSYQAAGGLLAIQQQLEFWNGSGWVICNTNAPWVYNSGPQSHSTVTGFGWSSPPCGAGYYADTAASYFNNGGWAGAWVVTNYLYVG